MFNRVKNFIKDFKEWVSPWYPIQVVAPFGATNDLIFEKYYGKRFIDRKKRLLNRLLPLILEYGKREFFRRYGEECKNWLVVNYPKEYIALCIDSVKGTIHLRFCYNNLIKTATKVEELLYEIVEHTWQDTTTCSTLRDAIGREYYDERHYSINATDFFISTSVFV